ncbi:YjbH domain-containing protein [Pseudodonghicola flavimaris]|uniref:YjbH domain-containing protein n=1 Tax=Pseudodonghicola flavimaris TaxID=3050036 RepID=A0ABT7EZH4_9RHOB|nr:YjbH domain-containing protein [Pseudodonghicola flavimaris]MDK3017753.1 YjbH domain-containing protein [Pseudodonghicola flavimaris]
MVSCSGLHRGVVFSLLLTAIATPNRLWAEVDSTYNTYGYPGLIDMPAAVSPPDAELALSFSHFHNNTRSTLTFQFLRRLSASFRYASIQNTHLTSATGAPVIHFRFDRSFSLHYRFRDETPRWPALAVGLNDIIGTGVYASEYVVATKTLRHNVRVTGGIGWGRLGSMNGFSNPLGLFGSNWRHRHQMDLDADTGGELKLGDLFHGDAAFFGGVEWQATPRLKLIAEYSSDSYDSEDGTTFDRRIPLNIGAVYRLRPMTTLAVNYLYGSELGVQLSMALNPKQPPFSGGRDPAPPPVVARGTPAAELLEVSVAEADKPALETRLRDALAAQSIELRGFSLTPTIARVVISGGAPNKTAQNIGRTARILTAILPTQIETFELIPLSHGLAPSQVTLQRRTLEREEFALDGSWASYAQARIAPAEAAALPPETSFKRFRPHIGVYLQPAFFDPDEPLRADFGLQASAQFEPRRGLIFSGSLRKKLIGTLDQSTRTSDSVLPHVRSDGYLYDRDGDPAIPELTAAYYFQPGDDLFGRMTLGYLEPMFGGLSTELLWSRNDSNFAAGIELNYVQQRDFDQLFGFQDYKIVTGHVSGYWSLQGGFDLQLDVGRYLAGDWGSTITVERTFRNGWRLGAFATFTDVSFEDFGEGSFDKGLMLTIPVGWVSGDSTQENYATVIRPLQRDGGARLKVAGRLHEVLRAHQRPGLKNGWGRFWR